MLSVLLSEYVQGMDLVKEKIKPLIKGNEKVVIISWVFPFELDYDRFENEWFKKNDTRYNKYVRPLIELGIKEENIKVLNCYDKSINFKKEVDESNILVMTGGNPEMLYSKVAQETEILYNIKHYKGLIIGFSAGACIQFKRYFITAKNNYYKYFAFYDGFGVLNDPFYIDVHSIKNKMYLDKLKKIADDKKKDVYAVFDNGAIIYNRSNYKIETFGEVLKFENKNI